MKKQFILPIFAILSLFLMVSVFAEDWTPNLNNGLVSYWNFNESSGVVASNLINPSLNGDLINDVNFVSGIVGNSVNISDGDNYVNISGLVPIACASSNLSCGFTINFWSLFNGGGTWIPFNSHNQVTNDGSIGTDGYPSAFWFYTGTSSHGFDPFPNSLSGGTWQMITFMRNASDECIFINGTLYLCRGRDGNVVADGWYLGREAGYTGGARMLLDEFGVWDRWMNESEVAQLYNNGIPIIPEETVEPIEVTIVYPQDSVTYNIAVSNFNYWVNSTSPDSCWYSRNGGTTNSTPVVAGTNFTGVTSVEGSNTWSLFCNDTAGNIDSDDSVTFFVDTTPPSITIQSPLNQTYNTTEDENYANINFSINISEEGSCVYSFDNGETNYSMTASVGNTQFDDTASIINGSHQVIFYCEDEIAWTNSIAVDFTVFQVQEEEEGEIEEEQTSGQVIQSILTSSGAGLGMFFQFMVVALPPLLLGIAVVGIMVWIAIALWRRLGFYEGSMKDLDMFGGKK
jgi:hypothetical protein